MLSLPSILIFSKTDVLPVSYSVLIFFFCGYDVLLLKLFYYHVDKTILFSVDIYHQSLSQVRCRLVTCPDFQEALRSRIFRFWREICSFYVECVHIWSPQNVGGMRPWEQRTPRDSHTRLTIVLKLKQ